jgi:hypothetical protein
MKIDIETKYSIGDQVFITKIIHTNGSGFLDIKYRKITSIDLIIDEKGPVVYFNLQDNSTFQEAGIFKTANDAHKAGIAELVGNRLLEDEDDDDGWDGWDEDEEDGGPPQKGFKTRKKKQKPARRKKQHSSGMEDDV